ncbi:MAG: glycosyltransferase [Crocinitomicaceae bacterium]|nr:glycosyltransferase [Crocinitomicaceae bacterium]
MKNLLLITAGFPFGKSETFLENELPIIAPYFEKVTILAVCDGLADQREVPINCEVHGLHIQDDKQLKLKALALMGSKWVKKEKKWIRKAYQQSVTGMHQKIMLMSLAKAKHIQKWIKKNIEQPQNTVAYSYWGDDAAVALALLQRKNFFAKAVCRVHRWDLYPSVNSFPYLPFRNFITNHLNTIHSISEDGIVAIADEWKCKISSVELSRLGVKKQVFSADQSKQLLVSCSNVIPVKRVELIVSALEHIQSPLHWTHFGDGPQFDALKKLAQDLPENIKVTFKGRVANSDVLDFYRKNCPTAFINVSSSEGVPVSIMEAFSFGIPVIATEVGGNGEIVNNNNGVLLAAHPSEEEVAEAIAAIFEATPEAYTKKSQAAFATWENDYHAEKNYNGFVGELFG